MNPLRPVILAAARSPRVEQVVTRAPVSRDIVRRFVAGSTRAELLPVVRGLLATGRCVSVDFLGEDTTDRAQADATVAEYCALIDELATSIDDPVDSAPAGAPVRLEVSVKLSALGQALPVDGASIATDNAGQICVRAAAAGVWVTVDMEDHTTTDATLAAVTALRPDFPWLGAVLQAYLRRTEQDCRDLAGPGSRIRLCKGAYREPVAVAYHDRAEIDDSYRRCLEILFSGSGYPMVATHDPVLISEVTARKVREGGPANGYEHQMLFGIQEREQGRLIGQGIPVRVYVPYGDRWFSYFMRRIAERPANMAFFLRSLRSRS